MPDSSPPQRRSTSKSPSILPEELTNRPSHLHSQHSDTDTGTAAATTTAVEPLGPPPTPTTRTTTATVTTTTTTRTKSSRHTASTTAIGVLGPVRHPSQNDYRITNSPITALTSSSESGVSTLQVSDSILPSLDPSPDTHPIAPASAQNLIPGTGHTRRGDYDNYHGDHPTQHPEDLIIPGTQSPSLGPHGLQVLPEDVTEEQAGDTSFTPASNKDASYSDHSNSLTSSNKSSDDSFSKANQSADSQQSNTSTRSNHSDPDRSSGLASGSQNSGSQLSGSQQSSSQKSTSNSQVSHASQHSVMSFAGVKTSTPRKEELSQHSTPTDPSPAISQQSPLGTYSTNPDSQQYPTQEGQLHGQSPTVTVQMFRQVQRSSQEITPLQLPTTGVDQRGISGQRRVTDQDDPLTLPLDDFGPDPPPDDVEAGFQAAEASFTQASSSQTREKTYKDDDDDDDDDGVGEITSQDIHSPLQSPSPANSKKRTQRDEDDDDVGNLGKESFRYEFLPSDGEEDKSGAERSSIATSHLELHYTMDDPTDSMSIQPQSRSRPPSKTSADETSTPPAIHPSSPTSASQPLDVPIVTQKSSNPVRSRTSPLPPSPPPITKTSAVNTKSKSRPARSPRRHASQPEELPSSQNSGTSQSGLTSFSERLQTVVVETDAEIKLRAAVEIKRRRTVSSKDQQEEVASSVLSEADTFWVSSGTEVPAKVATTQEKSAPRARSRSGSQEIASYPNEQPSETEIEEHLGVRDKGKEKAVDEDDESALSSAAGPSSRTRSAISPSKSPARPRINSPSTLRRKGSRGGSVSTLSTRTNPPRRTHSKIEILRPYKMSDPVWAHWNKDYYAGTVEGEESNKYKVHFLDGDTSVCERGDMRPLRLQLGAEVLAGRKEEGRKEEGKKEMLNYPATVEGFQISKELHQSRVDVRFEDNVAANVALLHVVLTQDMMDNLDRDIDWDMEDLSVSAADLLSQPDPSSAEASTPPSTPKRGKGLSRVASTGISTPSRRGRSEALSSLAPATPTRRGKETGIFKDFKFVISLGDDAKAKEKEKIVKNINDGKGEVWEDFSKLVGIHRSDPQTNVVLIAYTHLRTPKYMDALAMNIPRLSYRWVDACLDAGQLLPYHHYRLPTGFSRELGAIVSTEPINDRGIFDGLRIGLCGSDLMKKWMDKLKAAGATVVKVTARSGPMSCNYIVFVGADEHKEYCNKHGPMPSLAEEWLIQCMINQRIVAIREHPSYTDFKKLPDA
ncbi:hypothetical protein EC957_005804 [Mortierella hygrophila]|uniref:BRCT domain-containing protein n=1 Tax=Mortierella hygrophila TaxID=979708 RepID=A0A9P6F0E8_9FUNG|nr:hypothetical protein EC957_005804 [Mortierella hygrophila]